MVTFWVKHTDDQTALSKGSLVLLRV